MVTDPQNPHGRARVLGVVDDVVLGSDFSGTLDGSYADGHCPTSRQAR